MSPLITWKKDYSVGVSEIDRQHQKIVEIINQLHELSTKAQAQDKDIGKIFKELSDYAKFHFATEEKYFKKYKYERAEGHIEMHENYKDKVADLKHRFNKHEQVLAELTSYLQEWWVWHINTADKHYTDCFHEHGLE